MLKQNEKVAQYFYGSEIWQVSSFFFITVQKKNRDIFFFFFTGSKQQDWEEVRDKNEYGFSALGACQKLLDINCICNFFPL